MKTCFRQINLALFLGACAVGSVCIPRIKAEPQTPIRDKNAVAAEQQYREHEKWVARCLKEMESITVGMKRRDIDRYLTTEGGIYSAKSGHYTHRECPYFKVDIEFEPTIISTTKVLFNPEDKITKVSRPYLQWAIVD